MCRSVKDLRELNNISRLSFHGDESDFHNNERQEKVVKSFHSNHNGPNSTLKPNETMPRCIRSTEYTEKEKSSLRDIRFKTLPAINCSNTITDSQGHSDRGVRG